MKVYFFLLVLFIVGLVLGVLSIRGAVLSALGNTKII